MKKVARTVVGLIAAAALVLVGSSAIAGGTATLSADACASCP